MVGYAAFASRSGSDADAYSIDEGDGRGFEGFRFWVAMFARRRGGAGIDGYFLAWTEDGGGEGPAGKEVPLVR